MRLQRMLGITKKTLRSLKHDRRTMGFIIIVPLMIMTIFGYTFGGEVKNISAYIVNFDEGATNGSVSQAIIAQLESRDTLKILGKFGPEDAAAKPKDMAIQRITEGRVWAALLFDANFSSNVMASLSAMQDGGQVIPVPLEVYVDGSNPNIAQAVIVDIQRAVQEVLVSQYGLLPPMAISQELVYGENVEFLDFFAPGVMGLAAMMVTFMLSIISFVHERSSSTLDRLLASPITEGEIVGGYALAFGLVALAQSTIIFLAAILLFQIQIVGSPLLVLLLILLLGIGSQGMGFLLSSIAKTEFQAVQFLPLIFIPSILLAGVFWPIEAIPAFLRPVSYFIPLTYAVDGCRSVMVRGWGFAEVSSEIMILLLFALAMLILSTYTLKRRG